MKKIFAVPFIAIALTFILSTVAMARELNIVNDCGFTLIGLDLSDTNSSEGQSILDGTLPHGYMITIDLQGGDSGWDLIAVADDESYVAFENLDFSGVTTVYLHGDGSISGE